MRLYMQFTLNVFWQRWMQVIYSVYWSPFQHRGKCPHPVHVCESSCTFQWSRRCAAYQQVVCDSPTASSLYYPPCYKDLERVHLPSQFCEKISDHFHSYRSWFAKASSCRTPKEKVCIQISVESSHLPIWLDHTCEAGSAVLWTLLHQGIHFFRRY